VAREINIPKLGMSMREATLVEWVVQEGALVNQGQVILIIETEKTKWEVEAAAAGFVHILIPADPDRKEPVGQVVGLIAESEEELKALQAEGGVAAGPAKAEPKAARAAAQAAPAGEGRAPVSPLARRLAEEHDIDLAQVKGTGPGGRIVKEDVLEAIEAKKAAPAPGPAPAAAPAQTGEASAAETIDGKRVKATLSLKTGMRGAIARHMRESLAVSAQLTLTGEIDMTEVKRLREKLLQQEDRLGTRITYNDIFVLAVTRALRDFPIVNASVVGNEIKVWEDIHIGVAVALEGQDPYSSGLIVPVIRHADRMSLAEISKAAKALAAKAREGKILPDDVTGSTFTLTNLGGAGGGYGFGTPIINQPESAILGTGAITDRAVVRSGEIVIRPIMTYSLTFDHRVIDGYPATLFVARLTELLENPLLML